MDIWKVSLAVFLVLVAYHSVSLVMDYFFVTSVLEQASRVTDRVAKDMLKLSLPSLESASRPASRVQVSSTRMRWVPGRPFLQCARPDDRIDEAVMRCHHGYYELIQQ
jgi:hypothetical protein